MERTWWKEAVIYQIYPRSFRDTNGDGIGDLQGIIEKLDYLKELGVDVIWLNPIYSSPNDDGGYDISDYQAINPAFGSMADWEALLAGLHQRGMKLVMDLVVNHTSDEHPWFVASRSSRTNPQRDFYLWRPAPNNWRSLFAGPAWAHDEATGEYYLHLFSRKMPELNWANPDVRQAIYAMMHWWLRKGIDGFRLDVINLLVKPEGLPDAPDPTDHDFYFNQPGIHELLQEMNREVLSRYDIFTVGEIPAVTPATARPYVAADRHELNMLFQFEHFETIDRDGWDLPTFKQLQRRWYEGLAGAWNSQFIGNHDGPRAVSRLGDDGDHRVSAAKLLGTMNLTLPGTPYIYQGDEIGMTNVSYPSIDDYRDIQMVSRYREAVAKGAEPEAQLRLLQPTSRDNARTPFQWSAGPNAGFSSATPWLPVNPRFTAINLAADLASPDSVCRYYQRLTRLRRATPALIYGDYRPYLEADPHLYVYERSLPGERVLVLLNLSGETHRVELPQSVGDQRRELLLANAAPPADGELHLGPWEARIYRLC